ncbi:MAG: ThuA domain-containing protein [Balneolaceae bacterium]|nr:ThuA domain-containing protein [Balneolaceae bacterium]
MIRILLYVLTVSFLFGMYFNPESASSPEVLVFTKTEGFGGYRHASIEDGKKMFSRLAEKHDFDVTFTEDVSYFTDDTLKNYRAIVFLSTTGDLFTSEQQVAIQRFIQAGGGFMGIHGASGTEYDWPWYGKMLGAWFESHPKDQLQKATITLTDTSHPSTKHLPNPWEHAEEWYNFESLSPDIQELGYVDEDDYTGGKHGENHPIFWYQEFDGGRSFYTALGHHPEAYYDSNFVAHIWGGIQYVIGDTSPDYSRNIKPHEYKFNREKLMGQPLIGEPIELAIADNGDVYVVSRRGEVSVYHPSTGQAKRVGTVLVNHQRYDGMVGITLDPDFEKNRWLYLYYPTIERQTYTYHLSRFTLDRNGMLNLDSEKRMLDVPHEKISANHSGGSMTFDAAGNLYLSTGDNTDPFESGGYGPIDEREGRMIFDAQRSSGNTNDLRGKILRIHPEDDGSYTIPDGNLFAKNQEGARPEIYIMGLRNPYTISIDPETSWLYWGDVGPDARTDSVQGPKGYDEINQAREAGNYGWPYFVADNKAYADVDFETGEVGKLFDPKAPVNDSHRNTGLRKLPPAQEAFIWYPYDESKRFPAVGTGGRNAITGPVYHYQEELASEHKLPAYYDGHLFIVDWIRNWIMTVRMDQDGNFKWMESFMPSTKFDQILDIEFGPDGALYVIEYGNEWRVPNPEASLSRISFDINADQSKSIAKNENETGMVIGRKLISDSDCEACHSINTASLGPSFADIAERYSRDTETVNRLANTIINGSSGNWGERPMVPHPNITQEEAIEIVNYILSLSE